VKHTLILAVAWVLSGCASVNFSLLQVNSLSSETPGIAAFDGLEALAERNHSADKRRVNIIFLHGIGRVENSTERPLANAFIQGVAEAYGVDVEEKTVGALCGRNAVDTDLSLQNHIYIKSPEVKAYRTAIPGRQLRLDRIVCMDRKTLSVRDDLDYVIYRIFWDDIMWENLQSAHVGQDAGPGNSSQNAVIRRSLNGSLKDDIVNFGFSDAIMYLGPAGQEIRSAIRGAMCAAALEANGLAFEDIGNEVDHQEICAAASQADIDVDPFAFVAESLGSKIALDIMRDAMTDGRETVHDFMIRQTQVFMLANQIPLLSLSDLSDRSAYRPSDYRPVDRPTFIAFSEINDLLSYELVPFYEQLYNKSRTDPAFNEANTVLDGPARRKLVSRLGFNVIDVRVEFAKPPIPLVKSFVDPEFAHNGHVHQPEIMDFILCCADNYIARLGSCDVNRSSSP
jgi:hypothetical protein